MWIRSSQAAQSTTLRIPSCASAEINFIPVDCVVADMLALARANFGTQPIYHLTSTASVTVAECFQAITEIIGLRNVQLVPPSAFEPSPAERLIARRIGFFLSYIAVDRRFHRTLQPSWSLDAADFAAYVHQAVQRVHDAAPRPHAHAG